MRKHRLLDHRSAGTQRKHPKNSNKILNYIEKKVNEDNERNVRIVDALNSEWMRLFIAKMMEKRKVHTNLGKNGKLRTN